MSYTALLEEYEEQNRICTFSEMAANFSSLAALVEEEVDFSVMISLDEAAEEEIENKDKKISDAIKNGFKKLADKLEAFVTKIGEFLSRLKNKIKVTVASKGNEAMKKLLADKQAYIKKDIKLQNFQTNTAKTLLKAANDIVKDANAAVDAAKNGQSFTRVDAEKIKTFKEDVTKSKLVNKAEIKASAHFKVAEAYKMYVSGLFDAIESSFANTDKNIKDAQKAAKDLAKELRKADRKNNKSSVSELNGVASDLMTISTYVLKLNADFLSMATRNSAKLALAATTKDWRADADKKNEKEAAKKRKAEEKEAKRAAKEK
jgi:hypothetical protein